MGLQMCQRTHTNTIDSILSQQQAYEKNAALEMEMCLMIPCGSKP